MSDIIRVLNVTTVLQAAGIESFIMNMYRNIDRDKVQFDFMVMRNEKEFYDDEIKALGGKKYTIERKESNTLLRIIKEAKELRRFLEKNPYQIVHIHYTTPLRAFYLLAAKKAGIPVRIYHSHSAEVSGKSGSKLRIYQWCRKKISLWGTDFRACSQAAADWMFEGKALRECVVLNNGIDTRRFRYNEEDRARLRRELGIGDSFAVVHTGRFLDQKNHKFIISVFNKMLETDKNCVLLLLGAGPLEDGIRELVNSYGISDSVKFLGVRSDVYAVLNSADCYLMPSLYEGLPVSAIEAQAVGLPCVLSQNITDEVKINDNVSFLSLDEPPEAWAKAVFGARGTVDKNGYKNVISAGYDVSEEAAQLEKTYIAMTERKK